MAGSQGQDDADHDAHGHGLRLRGVLRCAAGRVHVCYGGSTPRGDGILRERDICRAGRHALLVSRPGVKTTRLKILVSFWSLLVDAFTRRIREKKGLGTVYQIWSGAKPSLCDSGFDGGKRSLNFPRERLPPYSQYSCSTLIASLRGNGYDRPFNARNELSFGSNCHGCGTGLFTRY